MENSPYRLTVTELMKRIPNFHGSRRSNTALKIPLLDYWIQTTASSHVPLGYILILSFHLPQGLPSDLFPSGIPTYILYAFLV
jgi:hypothetical protein